MKAFGVQTNKVSNKIRKVIVGTNLVISIKHLRLGSYLICCIV